MSPFQRVTYRWDAPETITVNGKSIPPEMQGAPVDPRGRTLYAGFYRRDANRLDVLLLKEGVQPGPETWERPERHLSRVVVDDSPATLNYDNSSASVRSASLTRRTPAGFAPENTVRMEAGALRGGQALDGILMGRVDKSLPDILRGATDLRVAPTPQLIGRHATYLLECTDQGKGYQYQVWIDPEAGFHPRRIVQKRLNPQGDGADVTVNDVVIEKVGDRFIPVAARISTTYRSGPAYLYVSETEYRRSDFDFEPDFAAVGAFKMLVPPGIGWVRNQDAPEIDWEFRDGKFVARIDEQLVQSMDAMIAAVRADAAGTGGGTVAVAAGPGKGSPAAAAAPAAAARHVAPDRGAWVWLAAAAFLACAAGGVLLYWRRRHVAKA